MVLSDKVPISRWERTALASGAMMEEMTALKLRIEGDILAFGGVGFASALVAAGLVDEFQLFVNPAAVGVGRSIFSQLPHGLRLELLDSDAFECGIVVSRYVPAKVG